MHRKLLHGQGIVMPLFGSVNSALQLPVINSSDIGLCCSADCLDVACAAFVWLSELLVSDPSPTPSQLELSSLQLLSETLLVPSPHAPKLHAPKLAEVVACWLLLLAVLGMGVSSALALPSLSKLSLLLEPSPSPCE
jgi:hypothetical protein